MIAFMVPEPLRASFFPLELWEKLVPLAPLAQARVLVMSWGHPPISASFLDRAPDLELVAHTGASLRALVTEEASARGVRFTQAGPRRGYGRDRNGGPARLRQQQHRGCLYR